MNESEGRGRGVTGVSSDAALKNSLCSDEAFFAIKGGTPIMMGEFLSKAHELKGALEAIVSGTKTAYCREQMPGRFNILIIDYTGKLVFSGRLERGDFYRVFHDSCPAKDSINPAGVPLITDHVLSEFLQHIYLGRFRHAKYSDLDGLLLKGVVRDFVLFYGEAFKEKMPTFVEIRLDRTLTYSNARSRHFNVITFYAEPRFAPIIQRYLKTGFSVPYLFGAENNVASVLLGMERSMRELLIKNPFGSAALSQFAENLYRLANDMPSIQDELSRTR